MFGVLMLMLAEAFVFRELSYQKLRNEILMGLRSSIISALVICLLAVVLTGCQSPTMQNGSTRVDPIRSDVVETERADAGWSWLTDSIAAEGDVQPADDDGMTSGDAPADADCPFRPTELRIHPLTRLLRSAGSASTANSIEVRVELKDQFGDTTKGLGDLRFELCARANGGGVGRVLLSWEPDFVELKANAEQFDRVTRTYVFLLDLSQGADLPKRCTLQAGLMIHGAELTDRFDVTFP